MWGGIMEELILHKDIELKTKILKNNKENRLAEIRLLIAEGKTSKEITDLLDITERTYFNYLKKIRLKYSDDQKYSEAIVKILETQEYLLLEAIKIYSNSKTVNERIQAHYLISKNLKDLKDTYDRLGLIPHKLKEGNLQDIDGMNQWLNDRHKTFAQRVIDNDRLMF
jgi:transposase